MRLLDSGALHLEGGESSKRLSCRRINHEGWRPAETAPDLTSHSPCTSSRPKPSGTSIRSSAVVSPPSIRSRTCKQASPIMMRVVRCVVNLVLARSLHHAAITATAFEVPKVSGMDAGRRHWT